MNEFKVNELLKDKRLFEYKELEQRQKECHEKLCDTIAKLKCREGLFEYQKVISRLSNLRYSVLSAKDVPRTGLSVNLVEISLIRIPCLANDVLVFRIRWGESDREYSILKFDCSRAVDFLDFFTMCLVAPTDGADCSESMKKIISILKKGTVHAKAAPEMDTFLIKFMEDNNIPVGLLTARYRLQISSMRYNFEASPSKCDDITGVFEFYDLDGNQVLRCRGYISILAMISLGA